MFTVYVFSVTGRFAFARSFDTFKAAELAAGIFRRDGYRPQVRKAAVAA